MAKRSIQGYVELASGLGELTANRAKEAATEIVALAGVDGSRKKVQKQAGRLADELLKAAQSNRKHLVRLVRKEVDTAVSRLELSRIVADVQGLGASVAALAGQVDDLARGATGFATSSADTLVEPARVAATTPAPATKAAARKAARTANATKSTAKKSTAKKATAKATAKKATAKKATAKKATAKKATANKATAKKATAKKATANKATATKATVKRAARASTNTPAPTTAKSTAAKKSTATRSTTAKKSTANKTAAARRLPTRRQRRRATAATTTAAANKSTAAKTTATKTTAAKTDDCGEQGHRREDVRTDEQDHCREEDDDAPGTRQAHDHDEPGEEGSFRDDERLRDAECHGLRGALHPGLRDIERPGISGALQPGVRDAERPGISGALQPGLRDAECRVLHPGIRRERHHGGWRVTEPHHDDHPDDHRDVESDEQPTTAGGADPAPPETGDIVIDAALRDLAAAPADDLDAQLQSGEAVHRTLQSRLSDLGG